jgi:sorting nexin-29
MLQRKEELESKFKGLDAKYKEELQKSKAMSDKLAMLEQETKNKNENYDTKIQNLESENRLLKDQLKKYVSAVQMIRSNTIASSSPADITGASSTALAATLPAVNHNLQRDYSYEAEQYEKKLIQVD